MSHETSSRAAAKIKAHKKSTNTQIHNKRINKINLVAFVQPTKKELFKCLLPAFTDVREQQGLDHTIYPIGEWSVRALLTTGTSQEQLIFPWILHSNSCSKLSRATGGDIPTRLSFAWFTCLEGYFKQKSAGPCNTLDRRHIRLPEEYNLILSNNLCHFSLDRYRKLTEVAVLSFACNEQLRQRPDYAKLPRHSGPRPAESPMWTHELKCHSNTLAHTNFTKPKLDMLIHPPLSKNTSLPNAMLPNVKLFCSFCNYNG